MKNKNTNILDGSLYKAILALALPIMLNNLIGSLYNLADSFWVSKIGDVEVAAVSFIWPISALASAFAMGISVAGAAIMSQRIGANNIHEANETASQLFILAIVMGILSSLLGFVLAPWVIHLMGARGTLFNASVSYLQILFLELPLLYLMNVYFSINQAQGDTLTPTLLGASSALLNVLLDPLFIFTFQAGIKGAALATVLSKVPFAVFAIYHLTSTRRAVKINLTKLQILPNRIKELVLIGLPSTIGSSGLSLGFILLHIFVVAYGDFAMTALAIGNRINSLAFMPAVGIGAALTTIVGQNLGANNPVRVNQAYKISLRLSLLVLSCVGILLYVFARPIVGIFSNTETVLFMGSTYLKMLALTTWSIAFFNCTVSLFNGSGHTLFSMALDISRIIIIRIPLIYICDKILHLDHFSIWVSVACSNILAAGLAVLLAKTGVWKTPKIKNTAKLSF